MVFVAIMIGWPMPLGVLQILWLNLVTDIFPAMALALEPKAPDDRGTGQAGPAVAPLVLDHASASGTVALSPALEPKRHFSAGGVMSVVRITIMTIAE